jgi:hypothetical protein
MSLEDAPETSGDLYALSEDAGERTREAVRLMARKDGLADQARKRLWETLHRLDQIWSGPFEMDAAELAWFRRGTEMCVRMTERLKGADGTVPSEFIEIHEHLTVAASRLELVLDEAEDFAVPGKFKTAPNRRSLRPIEHGSILDATMQVIRDAARVEGQRIPGETWFADLILVSDKDWLRPPCPMFVEDNERESLVARLKMRLRRLGRRRNAEEPSRD